jgi:hypothetical protein
MITCNLMGGLGNQLFQIFATISYGIKSRNQFTFLNVETLGGGSTTLRYTFWNTLLHKLKFFLIDHIPNYVNVIREKDFTFNELPINQMIGKDTMIYGYFQSYKYFESNYNIIYKLLGIKEMKTRLLTNMDYNDDDFLKKTVSMHFRIGDYKKVQHCHPIMTKEYYFRSLKFLETKYKDINFTIMYFCENEDLDEVIVTIKNLELQFPNYTFIRADNKLEDWQQMLLMSCCHHNIIANSSFSWWGAYLNDWQDKIVCYPSVWFGPTITHNTKDLCPPEWNKIQA